jgi:hypothetical protein
MPIPTRADLDAAYATAQPGYAYNLPRPAVVYDYDDCDEMTPAALATLDEVRTRIISREGGTVTARHFCRIVDDLALETVQQATEGDEDGE